MKLLNYSLLLLASFFFCLNVQAKDHKSTLAYNNDIQPLTVSFDILDHCEGDNPTITATVTGGLPPYIYNWTNGATTETTTIIEPANGNLDQTYTYVLVVTDNNGTFTFGVDQFTVFALPNPAVTTHAPDCETGLGQICFSFEDYLDRRAIEFDLGNGYLPHVPDNTEEICYDVEPGTYDLETRWGNDECPVDLGQVTIDPMNFGCSSLPFQNDGLVFDENQCLVFIDQATVKLETSSSCPPVNFTFTLSYSDGSTFDVTSNATMTQDGTIFTFHATSLGFEIPPCTEAGNDVSELFSIKLTYADGSMCTAQGGNKLCRETANLPCGACEELCEDPDCCDIEGEATVKGVTCTSVKVCVTGFENCPEVDYNIYYVVLGGQPLSESDLDQNRSSSEPCKTFTGLDPCRSYQFFAQVIIPDCAPINVVDIQCENCNEEGVFTFRESCCGPIPFTDPVDDLANKNISNSSFENTLSVTVNPNPFSSQFEITVFSNSTGDYDFVLFDLHGRQIKTLKGNLDQGINTIDIEDLNDLTPGVYMYQLKTSEGVLINNIVKQ